MGQPKGCIPWNKNKKGSQIPWNKGLKLPTGKAAYAWKGGRYETDGYVVVYVPNHPRVKNQTRPYLFEHIIVAEKKLGRYLLKNEVVHHLNGIRNDNRPDNIVVITRAKHLLLHNPMKYFTPKDRAAYWATTKHNCSICSSPYFAKGFCRKHYKAMRRKEGLKV